MLLREASNLRPGVRVRLPRTSRDDGVFEVESVEMAGPDRLDFHFKEIRPGGDGLITLRITLYRTDMLEVGMLD